MDLIDPNEPQEPPAALKPNDPGFSPYRRVGETLRVRLLREPFMPWFELRMPNGTSEQLEPDETRQWFAIRGANMDKLEKALDYVWNFYGRQREVYFDIKDPVEVSQALASAAEPLV